MHDFFQSVLCLIGSLSSPFVLCGWVFFGGIALNDTSDLSYY